MPYVTAAVRALTHELGETPLIGFAGAPFTLASYLIEGGPSKDHARTKALMHDDPELWHELLGRLAVIAAGVPAGADRRRRRRRPAVRLLGRHAVAGPTTSASCCRTAARCSSRWPAPSPGSTSGSAPGSCCRPCAPPEPTSSASTGGCRWTRRPAGSGPAPWCRATSTPPCWARSGAVVEAEVRRVVREGRAAAGHIFNLGHGVPPSTDPDVLTRIVELVRTLGP